ncbi:MAG: zinc ribbon domain-containing protein [Candidatus Hodarchaeales archaeon]
MPRGGGGGFRGGGFGGGGFRGGGFRGGSRSFRVGNVRRSGRPFGRTGSRRTVSRSPRSHRRRNYHGRRHRRYWGGYYRPWYRRWWHWGWWWGYPYRPWYYAPVYWGGGLTLGIIALLVILPLFSLAFIPYPFSNSSSTGIVTYQDTQTLGYNEYWYEREPMDQGQTIDYSVQATSEVTFLIWNMPFEMLPETRTLTGSYSETNMKIASNHDYQFIGYFLKPGSQLTYQFNVTSGGSIDFFVADANMLNRWNNWETIVPVDSYNGPGSYDNSISIDYAQDWYLVWYNPTETDIFVDFTVDYIAENNIDVSAANVFIEDVVDPTSGSFTVPDDGVWYFFVYMDPFVNYAESVDITFEVMYDTEVTYNDHWGNVTPVLLVIGFIIVVVLIIAVVQRRSTKKTPPMQTTTGAPTPTIPPSTEVETKATTCHRCKAVYRPGETYCTNCGAKLQGRDYGTSKVITPANSKWCKSCGNTVKPDSRFCRDCGAAIEQKNDTKTYFPDERKAFFCQLDNEQHPSTDSAYRCIQCSRMICANCFDDIGKTGINACPYCKGTLRKAQ